MKKSRLLPFMGIVVMLVVAELGAVLLGPLMHRAGIVAFEEPGSALNPLIFLVLLLGFTALLLVLIRMGMQRIIRAIVFLSIGLSFVYIFIALLGAVTAEPAIVLGGAVLIGAGAVILLHYYPEWYVIDLFGLLLAAGVAAIFGTSLDVLPVLLLLVLLAVYDALSVYRTRHMIALAEGVLEQRAPILFVVPKERGYSFIRDGVGPVDGGPVNGDRPATGEGTGRSALLIGMGDLIMPAILVVSANTFISATGLGFVNGPALGAIVGSVAGLVLLLRFVDKGRAHAGLPPLNGGAILGFLAGCAVTGAWAWF